MNAFLCFPADRRRLLCEEGRQRLGLPPASIEKDFWVCWTLRELFGLPGWGEHLTFKGGTSLSKGWRLIGIEGIENLPAVKWKLLNIGRMNPSKHETAVRKLRTYLGV